MLWILVFLAAVGSIVIAAVLLQRPEELILQNGWYEICTTEDYQLFWELVADGQSDLKGRLMNDIKMNNLKDRGNWRQAPPLNHSIEVGSFKGTFDGNGYTIYGLYSETGYGLVRENFGIIQNVNIRDSLIFGEYFAGGICYKNNRIISNCNMSGELCHNEDNLARMAGIAIANTGMIEKCTYNGIMSFSKNDGDRAGICAENRGKIEGCSNLAEQDMEGVFSEFYHAYAVADEGMDNCYVGKDTDWFVPEASHVLRIPEDQLYKISWLMEGNAYPLIVREDSFMIGPQSEDIYTACEDAFIFETMRRLLENETGSSLKIDMQAVEKEEGEDCIFAVKLTAAGQSLEIKAYLEEGIGENYDTLVECIAEILGEAGGEQEVNDQGDSWEHRTYQLTWLPERAGSQMYWIEEKTVPENLMLYRTKWETGFWYRQGEMLYQIILPEKKMSQGTAKIWKKLTSAAGGKKSELQTEKLLWCQVLNQLYTGRKASDGIAWKDEIIRKAVYKELSEDNHERIFSREEIMELEELTIEGAGYVESYQDLQYLPKLTSLNLHNGTIQMGDIDAPLTSLRIEGCHVRESQDICHFSELSKLEIVNNMGLYDFSFLGELPKLKELTVEGSGPTENNKLMNAVSKCGNLEKLSLRSDFLTNTNIEGLRYLSNLKELDLSFNDISDFSPLYGLQRLCKLSVNDNPGKELGQLIYIQDLSIGSHQKTVFDLEKLGRAQQVLDKWYPDNCLINDGVYYRDIEARDLAWGDFNEDGVQDLAVIGEGKETFDSEWNRISPAQKKIYLFQGVKDGFEEVQTISLPGLSLTETGDWVEGSVSYIAISGNHLLVQTKGLADGGSGGWNSISVYTWTEGRMKPECRHKTDYEKEEE